MTILHRNRITVFCTPLYIDLLCALNVAGYNSSLIAYLPCDMKFLWEFIFADWQFFVFCAN